MERSSILIATITGVLAIVGGALGTGFKRHWDTKLEEQKLESRIILSALENIDEGKRKERLKFIVEANLIKNEVTRESLRAWFDSKKPLPRFIEGEGKDISVRAIQLEEIMGESYPGADGTKSGYVHFYKFRDGSVCLVAQWPGENKPPTRIACK